MEHRDCPSVRPGESLLSGENEWGRAGRSVTNRSGFKPWPVLVLSVLGSAAAAAAVGFVCALIYPILKGKSVRLWTEVCLASRAHNDVQTAAFT